MIEPATCESKPPRNNTQHVKLLTKDDKSFDTRLNFHKQLNSPRNYRAFLEGTEARNPKEQAKYTLKKARYGLK
jgi:hypothetical protein